MNTRSAVVATQLGPVRLEAAAGKLLGLWFRGQQHELPLAAATQQVDAADDASLRAAAIWLTDYLDGVVDRPTPALDPPGTPFQRKVWDALLRIPRGSTTSYSTLARELGMPRATRAVAAAVGRNPISILIPCHRVIGSDGSLTGYAGGLGRKRALLALEQGMKLPWRLVTGSYAPQYADPVAIESGAQVRFVARSDDGEFPGWRWAVAADGRAGWVPQAWFRVNGDSGVARRSYSARELAVRPGDRLREIEELGGWVLAYRAGEQLGWVPQSALAAIGEDV